MFFLLGIYEFLVEELSESCTNAKVTCISFHFLLILNSLKKILTDYLASYLREGESHFIYIPTTYTDRVYMATLQQTNATNGFRVVFQDLYLNNDVEVQIGSGNDPSDIQSVITTIHGYINYEPADVYVDTNEMWFAAIGGRLNSVIRVDVEIISHDLSSEFVIILDSSFFNIIEVGYRCIAQFISYCSHTNKKTDLRPTRDRANNYMVMIIHNGQ